MRTLSAYEIAKFYKIVNSKDTNRKIRKTEFIYTMLFVIYYTSVVPKMVPAAAQ